jgi:hypothetical protein
MERVLFQRGTGSAFSVGGEKENLMEALSLKERWDLVK